jgi:RNA recognition motif-containing protein
MAGYKVFVGGVSEDTTDADLYDYFSQYGDLSDYVVMKRGGVSRGFGFVAFISKEAEEACLQNTRHLLNGRDVEVKSAVPGAKQMVPDPGSQPLRPAAPPVRDAPTSSTKVFVGGLLTTCTTDDLIAYFSQYGELNDCISMTGRGFGYVEFADPAVLEVVMETPLQHVILGKPVECKRCVPREAMGTGPRPGGAPAAPGGKGAGYGRAQTAEQEKEAYAKAYAEGYAAAKMEIQQLIVGGAAAAPGPPHGKGGYGKGGGKAPMAGGHGYQPY